MQPNVITNCCQLNVLDKVKMFGAGSFNVKNVIMDPAGDCAPPPPSPLTENRVRSLINDFTMFNNQAHSLIFSLFVLQMALLQKGKLT